MDQILGYGRQIVGQARSSVSSAVTNASSAVNNLSAQAQTYTIGHRTVKVDSKISEGGYAFVLKVIDVNTFAQYALKKIYVADANAKKTVENEIKIWRHLGDHENIVKFVDASVQKENGGTHILILCELCTQGTLFDLLMKYNGQLSEAQILHILKDVSQGLHYMHSQNPPIAHRDIKVENILLQNKKFKLCDFGSASAHVLDYSSNPTQNKIDQMMEDFEKFTTLMYRPPEMIDKYKKYSVNFQADIWMLGCVLYSICFFQHPFQDAQKLAIVNGHYFMPSDPRISEKMKDLIRLLLVADPTRRPTIKRVLHIISNWDSAVITLPSEAQEIKQKQLKGFVSDQKSTTQPQKDLTMDDISKIQEKIRLEQQQTQTKKKRHVPLPSQYDNLLQGQQNQPKQSAVQHSNSFNRPQQKGPEVNLFSFDNPASASNLKQPSSNSTGNNFFNWPSSNTQQTSQDHNDWFFNPQQEPKKPQESASLLEFESQKPQQPKKDIISELGSLNFQDPSSTVPHQTENNQSNLFTFKQESPNPALKPQQSSGFEDFFKF